MRPNEATPQTTATIPSRDRIAFLIGVDGGASGTRVCVANRDGSLVTHGLGRASALAFGRGAAWQAILETVKTAFEKAGHTTAPRWEDCAIGLGLSGAHNKEWAAEFLSQAPGFAGIIVETDGFTTLLGAHRGKPGAIVALGTGSVGEILRADGSRQEVGGWGFPTADEAGGSWIGMRAVRYAEQVLDGHSAVSPLSEAVLNHCGRTRDALLKWLARANQASYAKLAPIVIDLTPHDTVAARILYDAGEEVAKMASVLDPQGQYPLSLCGGLGNPLQAYLPAATKSRLVKPAADSALGALFMIAKHLAFVLQDDIWANSKH